MAVVSWIAWRLGPAGFGFYHITRNNARTLCGKHPDGLLSIWKGKNPPRPSDQCATCRTRWIREGEIR